MKKHFFPSALVAGLLLVSPAFADMDGDGIEPPMDCNDNDSQIYPGAFEIPGNSVDNDCDVHEECYRDIDDDGARATTTAESSDSDCFDAFEGRNTDPIDCDDNDPGTYPGGIEACDTNDRDEDCDGGADDLDAEGATGKSSWYADGDEDGYGDASDSVLACDEPIGRVAQTGDCDDGDPAISPDGVEVCDPSNEDEDCDGQADDLDGGGATGKVTRYPDTDTDGYGSAMSSVTVCDPLAGYVSNDEDCDDLDETVSPDGVETCDPEDPKDYNCDGLEACADATRSSAPGCTVEVFDHFECFKTTEKLKATLDADPGDDHAPFAAASGCTIGKAAKYCVPVKKTVAAIDASSTLTENPLYEGPGFETDNICYKLKCPTATDPGTVTVRDRFGDRDFTKFKVSEICTPAEIVP